MAAASVAIVGNAKRPSAISGHRNAGTGQTNLRIADAIGVIRDRKPWTYLVDILGVGPRVARHRIEGTRGFDADEIAALLQSEEGFKILTAMMADAQPKWWKLCSAFMDVAEAKRLQAVAERRITRAVRGALNANIELEQTIAQGTTALSLSDPEFYGERLAPQREQLRSRDAAARVPDRALAPTTKR